jgi:hypothetical protein
MGLLVLPVRIDPVTVPENGTLWKQGKDANTTVPVTDAPV